MQVMLEHPDRPLWQWQPVDSTLLTIMRAVGQILREFKLAAR